MTALTANEQSFVAYLLRSEEHLRKGIKLLLDRDDFDRFFDSLAGAALFDPAKNPSAIPFDDEKYYRVPYWPVLDYLAACARRAGERKDSALGNKVIEVVRRVSAFNAPDGKLVDNYHTFRVFADIVGLLPTNLVSNEDIALIPRWLESRFDRGGVCHALDNGAMKSFLGSSDPRDWQKALQVLRHICDSWWAEEKHASSTLATGPRTKTDDYWLGEFLEHHAPTLGSRLGHDALDVLEKTLREAYTNSTVASYLVRPAVEDDAQNAGRYGIEARSVSAFRDALLAWVDASVSEAKEYVARVLRDDLDILRRIGIYVINARWIVLSDLYFSVLGPGLFEVRHLHELYGLLAERFPSFLADQKRATVDAISNVQIPPDEMAAERVRRLQARWVSAIANKGSAAADELFERLGGAAVVGKHANFLTFTETRWGSGPSQYSPTDLLAFLQSGSLVSVLNDFKPGSFWEGPSKGALVKALEEAISLSPADFLDNLPAFRSAARCYQYGLINGFKTLWEKAPREDANSPLWLSAWPKLLEFIERLINSDSFWSEAAPEEADLTPTRDWIPSLISDFLHSGTRSDEKAFLPDLLPRALALIEILLAKSESASEPSDDDPMTQAINTPKGRAIEALFGHALRSARVADKSSGSHAAAWSEVSAIFDRELSLCRVTNYEFSTIAGCYLSQLQYLSREWVANHFNELFPSESDRHFACAIAGLAYAAATRDVFKALRDNGVIDRALNSSLPGRHSKEKLLERLAVAYLWGDEPLESSRFKYLFDHGLAEDLATVAQFFWSVSNQEIEDDQVNRVLNFWRASVAWSNALALPSKQLLRALSQLICYLDEIRPEDVDLVAKTVRYVGEHDIWELSEQLERLAHKSPAQVATVVSVLFENSTPVTDYGDKWKALIRTLSTNGQRSAALALTERLSSLPGMQEIYRELRRP